MNKAVNTLIWLVVIGAFAAGAYQAYRSGNQEETANPYEYDMSALKQVNPAQIGYREAGSFPAPGASAIALGPEDTLFVGTDSEIYQCTADGDRLGAVTVKAPVTCLAVGPKGVYGASKTRIHVYSLALKPLSSWPALPAPAHLTSLAVNDERLYAADAGRRMALAFDKQGTLLHTFGQKDERKGSPGLIIPSPYFDLFLDKQNRIWLVNPGRHGFERYSDSGDRVEHWQSNATGIEGFCGCCNPSHVTLLPNGQIATSEKGLVRIKVYDLKGTMLSVVATPSQFDDGTVGMDLAADSRGRILALDPKRGQIRIFERK